MRAADDLQSASSSPIFMSLHLFQSPVVDWLLTPHPTPLYQVPLSRDVNLEQIARGTPGFSGAELFNLVNQAALRASISGSRGVGMAELEYAKDKILMGSERKSAVLSPETIRVTAYHEAGHALVAIKTPGADPVHKATIMPRGRALGMVMQLPDGDQSSLSRKQVREEWHI